MNCRNDLFPFLDAGLNYQRPQAAYPVVPWPQMSGSVSGILPMFDTRPMTIANTPYGVAPWESAAMFTETIYPNLQKLRG